LAYREKNEAVGSQNPWYFPAYKEGHVKFFKIPNNFARDSIADPDAVLIWPVWGEGVEWDNSVLLETYHNKSIAHDVRSTNSLENPMYLDQHSQAVLVTITWTSTPTLNKDACLKFENQINDFINKQLTEIHTYAEEGTDEKTVEKAPTGTMPEKAVWQFTKKGTVKKEAVHWHYPYKGEVDITNDLMHSWKKTKPQLNGANVRFIIDGEFYFGTNVHTGKLYYSNVTQTKEGRANQYMKPYDPYEYDTELTLAVVNTIHWTLTLTFGAPVYHNVKDDVASSPAIQIILHGKNFRVVQLASDVSHEMELKTEVVLPLDDTLRTALTTAKLHNKARVEGLKVILAETSFRTPISGVLLDSDSCTFPPEKEASDQENFTEEDYEVGSKQHDSDFEPEASSESASDPLSFGTEGVESEGETETDGTDEVDELEEIDTTNYFYEPCAFTALMPQVSITTEVERADSYRLRFSVLQNGTCNSHIGNGEKDYLVFDSNGTIFEVDVNNRENVTAHVQDYNEKIKEIKTLASAKEIKKQGTRRKQGEDEDIVQGERAAKADDLLEMDHKGKQGDGGSENDDNAPSSEDPLKNSSDDGEDSVNSSSSDANPSSDASVEEAEEGEGNISSHGTSASDDSSSAAPSNGGGEEAQDGGGKLASHAISTLSSGGEEAEDGGGKLASHGISTLSSGGEDTKAEGEIAGANGSAAAVEVAAGKEPTEDEDSSEDLSASYSSGWTNSDSEDSSSVFTPTFSWTSTPGDLELREGNIGTNSYLDDESKFVLGIKPIHDGTPVHIVLKAAQKSVIAAFAYAKEKKLHKVTKSNYCPSWETHFDPAALQLGLEAIFLSVFGAENVSTTLNEDWRAKPCDEGACSGVSFTSMAELESHRTGVHAEMLIKEYTENHMPPQLRTLHVQTLLVHEINNTRFPKEERRLQRHIEAAKTFYGRDWLVNVAQLKKKEFNFEFVDGKNIPGLHDIEVLNIDSFGIGVPTIRIYCDHDDCLASDSKEEFSSFASMHQHKTEVHPQ
jgi:hypothetical protein